MLGRLSQLFRRCMPANSCQGKEKLQWCVEGAPCIQLQQDFKGDAFSASGLIVWPAARVLAEYAISRRLIHGKRVLELGAGTGAVGLACAAAVAHHPADVSEQTSLDSTVVVLTDRLVPVVKPLSFCADDAFESVELSQEAPLPGSRRQLQVLERNTQLNEQLFRNVATYVEELDIGQNTQAESVFGSHGPFDLVLGSDITYNRVGHSQLVSCLARLHQLHSGSELQVLLAHHIRFYGDIESLHAHASEANLRLFERHRKDDVVVLQVDYKKTSISAKG
eukprot:TRINITY_DN14330_c0_g1_i2.p1 TRINITY_DN14330_c0_g1~~TRINITY_DN14330_c0_g1_i2.p1  ORF type:complete len:279 (+),score=31.22 TRINITY_DN14330_c0_g1_i2:211-1047(+)